MAFVAVDSCLFCWSCLGFMVAGRVVGVRGQGEAGVPLDMVRID